MLVAVPGRMMFSVSPEFFPWQVLLAIYDHIDLGGRNSVSVDP
jgi:hypothetical protein